MRSSWLDSANSPSSHHYQGTKKKKSRFLDCNFIPTFLRFYFLTSRPNFSKIAGCLARPSCCTCAWNILEDHGAITERLLHRRTAKSKHLSMIATLACTGRCIICVDRSEFTRSLATCCPHVLTVESEPNSGQQ